MPVSLGQTAYETYCESRNWTGVNGDRLPPWHDQAQELKSAWDAAALAVELRLAAQNKETEGPKGPTVNHGHGPDFG